MTPGKLYKVKFKRMGTLQLCAISMNNGYANSIEIPTGTVLFYLGSGSLGFGRHRFLVGEQEVAIIPNDFFWELEEFQEND